MASRRYFIETWGCQMNELDTQRMAGQLMQQGLLPTEDATEASVILLNSCSVREKAAQKAYSRLGIYRRYKEERPDLVIGFCGCVAQQEGEEALEKVRDLDFVVGPARVGELTEILERVRTGERVAATGFPEQRDFDLDTISRDSSYKGMVTLIEGCNKKCTFCIVPYTRGPERCRPLAEIVREVEHLLALGFVEIELLGQTVNHWKEPGDESIDFAVLLDTVARLRGLERLRFITSYPRDFTPAMVAEVGRHENICPYVHLPVQSGSNSVLKLMGRGYEVETYFDLVDQLRAARDGLALSTDLIVGFPGETDEDFEKTLELVERVRYAQIFAFKYSPRPGTPAPRLKVDVPTDDVASERLQRVFAVQDRIQLELNQELVGEEREILVTGWGKNEGSQMGRTPCHRIVHFDPQGVPADLGSLVKVRIDDASHYSLRGTRLDLGMPQAPKPRTRLTVVQ
ncbi:MAG: tRNA (N6-isopentenyl adenosine(37)-C2)-methylthiotransferase MiaB [Thermoanaerobaculia bacterium]|nr:tRNA (N6-isopentenyl adenosine(37)-C2)-methylthiotransferase MiaB [Thermoanaerobaculia bacterium]